ncbi:hypothetical protein ABK040_014298 [Willaertia magna]
MLKNCFLSSKPSRHVNSLITRNGNLKRSIPLCINMIMKRFNHAKLISDSKLFEKAIKFPNHPAIITNDTKHHHQHHMEQKTYSQLLHDSGLVANKLIELHHEHFSNNNSNITNNKEEELKLLTNQKICFLFDPGYSYVVNLWAIWRTNAIAVPLCNTHPTNELKYYIENCECSVVIYQKERKTALEPLFKEMAGKVKFVEYDPEHWLKGNENTELKVIKNRSNEKEDGALIIYTSGTTSLPKGVVHTYSNVNSQITCLTDSWKWTENDHILHVLPLHHVHGLINALACALYVGATVQFCKFHPEIVWQKLTNSQQSTNSDFKKKINVFMAVPTIYVKLLHYYENLKEEQKKQYSNEISKLRLMVSGSAALPVPIFQQWKKITGHSLLERYGMSEIGMALSNHYEESKRKMGFVGFPLPGVEVKIVDAETESIEITKPNEPGELLIKGPNVFKEYYNKPDATKKSFTEDGWFKTGDTSLFDEEGYYKICGRSSVDIIKSGGYKISALDIERVILGNEKIKECAVVGVPDEEYGERIGAIIVNGMKDNQEPITLEELQKWCSQELAKYKLPTVLIVIPKGEEIPKNAMGKVNKKQLIKHFFPQH